MRHPSLLVAVVFGIVGPGALFGGGDDLLSRLRAAEQLRRRGEYSAAERILVEALGEADQPGADDLRKAVIFNNLGTVYRELNKYPQAEHCYRRAVEIEGRHWRDGDDRPIRAVVNLATLYASANEYPKAARLGLYDAAEHMPESRRNHPDFARLLALLGQLEQWQGKYTKAQQYGEQALAIFEALEPGGRQTLETLNNLCVLYGESGRNAQALSYCERALKIAPGIRDLEPRTQASLLANAGTFQFLIHGPRDAEPYFTKALTMAESGLGPGHPLVGHILICYAAVLDRTNRKAQARQSRRRAEAILNAIASSHPRKYTVDVEELLKK